MSLKTPASVFGLFISSLAVFIAAQTARGAPSLSALHQGDTIVFIGDSITAGGRARTGDDSNHTMGQSYAYIVSATLGERLAERDLTFINRGNSGDRVLDLQARWAEDVLKLKPQVLSILVGVNDTLWSKGETLEQYEQVYDTLIRETISALPNIKIVLGEPFVLPVGKYKTDYKAVRAETGKRGAIVARLAAKYKLPLIHYQQLFDRALHRAPADHWSWDGVHPHYAGHALMANAWIETVSSAWR